MEGKRKSLEMNGKNQMNVTEIYKFISAISYNAVSISSNGALNAIRLPPLFLFCEIFYVFKLRKSSACLLAAGHEKKEETLMRMNYCPSAELVKAAVIITRNKCVFYVRALTAI